MPVTFVTHHPYHPVLLLPSVLFQRSTVKLSTASRERGALFNVSDKTLTDTVTP